MDYFAILSTHLAFIRRFYEATADPFENRKKKIENGEEPFTPNRAPEDYDGPEYELEWHEADEFLRVLGQCALGLLEKGLHDYLRHFAVSEEWAQQKLDKGNWFKKYCAALEENTAFNWSNSPVSYEKLEQINLSRNDLSHDLRLGRIRSPQNKDHFARYPNSAFAEELEVAYSVASGDTPDEPWSLNVTREALFAHIEFVRQFCAFVEQHRTIF
jgi:hypothetical protein